MLCCCSRIWVLICLGEGKTKQRIAGIPMLPSALTIIAIFTVVYGRVKEGGFQGAQFGFWQG
jgi:hypothetical protein